MKKTAILMSLLAVNSAFALVLPTKNISNFDNNQPSSEYDFNGIVKLSNCSGSIIQFAGQSDDSPAILMTNGHCIKNDGRGFLKPGEVIQNSRVNFNAKVYNNETKLVPVSSTKLLYATMTNTDVAYYEIEKSYSDLAALGVSSFELDTFMPLVGTQIDIVSGFWDRGYRCSVDGIVFALLEGDWIFTNAIRYSNQGCDTIGGTSGSPIIETSTRRVVGINNTGNAQGDSRTCSINNPCEQTENGEISAMIRSYGQQTYNIYSCLSVDFQIDLSIEGCTLPK